MNTGERDYSQYRTFWPRVGAAFLDGAAFAPLLWMDKIIWNSITNEFLLISWTTICALTSLVYNIGFVVKYGQTPGKMSTGVKIIGLRDTNVMLRQAILRYLVPVILIPYWLFLQISNINLGHLENRAMGDYHKLFLFMATIMFWTFLEIVTMLTNKRRRAIHDFIAGTLVIRDPASKRRWLLWLLIIFLILNAVSQQLVKDPNIVIPFK